jgi:hypothetical protein
MFTSQNFRSIIVEIFIVVADFSQRDFFECKIFLLFSENCVAENQRIGWAGDSLQ